MSNCWLLLLKRSALGGGLCALDVAHSHLYAFKMNVYTSHLFLKETKVVLLLLGSLKNELELLVTGKAP